MLYNCGHSLWFIQYLCHGLHLTTSNVYFHYIVGTSKQSTVQYNIWWIIVEIFGLQANKPPPLEAEEQRKQIKKEREKKRKSLSRCHF